MNNLRRLARSFAPISPVRNLRVCARRSAMLVRLKQRSPSCIKRRRRSDVYLHAKSIVWEVTEPYACFCGIESCHIWRKLDFHVLSESNQCTGHAAELARIRKGCARSFGSVAWSCFSESGTELFGFCWVVLFEVGDLSCGAAVLSRICFSGAIDGGRRGECFDGGAYG
jgi:hypothetical protein